MAGSPQAQLVRASHRSRSSGPSARCTRSGIWGSIHFSAPGKPRSCTTGRLTSAGLPPPVREIDDPRVQSPRRRDRSRDGSYQSDSSHDRQVLYRRILRHGNAGCTSRIRTPSPVASSIAISAGNSWGYGQPIPPSSGYTGADHREQSRLLGPRGRRLRCHVGPDRVFHEDLLG